ncbi:hypothetical protein SLEP1_g37567 [Rubroshorea leprosula]|uniref:Secreted protein n=1 Tax=Rubroshorea leprosula TaxID=152421 RepID=A0AAV5KVF0_9ROSI|nr:hypothetical protein SLEP1_g37567 [Rubroshorea leprosula]
MLLLIQILIKAEAPGCGFGSWFVPRSLTILFALRLMIASSRSDHLHWRPSIAVNTAPCPHSGSIDETSLQLLRDCSEAEAVC